MPDPIPAVIVPPVPETPAPAKTEEVTPVAPAGDKPPDAPLSPASPAAKSRALSKELAATRKANEERAALAKERAEIAKEREKYKGYDADDEALKKDPLGYLGKKGLTYEELTKRAIEQHGANSIEARQAKLEATIAEDKAARAKAEADATAARQQAEGQAKLAAYIDELHAFAAKDAAAYEMIAGLDADYAKKMMFDVADEMYRRTGKAPDAKSVCDAIEKHFVEEGVRLAKSKKVAEKLAPAPAVDPAAPVKDPTIPPEIQAMIDKKNPPVVEKKPPSTLTNRNSASPMTKADEPVPGKMSKKEALRLASEMLRNAHKAP